MTAAGDRRRLLAARGRLLDTLADVADRVADGSLSRCPYRDRADRCGFRGGCRNQQRVGAARLCAGGPLDARPAARTPSDGSSPAPR